MPPYFTWGASLFTDPTAPSDATARMPAFPTYLLPSLEWVPFPRRPGAARSAGGLPSATGSGSPSSPSSPSRSSSTSMSSPVTSTTTTASSSRRASPERTPSDEHGAHQGAVNNNNNDNNNYNKNSSSSSYSEQRARNDGGRRRRLARRASDTLRCQGCSADITFASQIISKGFTGHHGRAYLVSPRAGGAPALDAPDTDGASLANVTMGPAESRQLVTGWHTVADVSCAVCGRKVGWKYVDAREPAQRYKIGKFILEAEQVVRHQTWVDVWDDDDDDDDENDDDDDLGAGGGGGPGGRSGVGGGKGGQGKGKGRAGQQGEGKVEEEEEEEEKQEEEEVEFDSDDSEECWEIFTATWDAKKVAARRRMNAANGTARG